MGYERNKGIPPDLRIYVMHLASLDVGCYPPIHGAGVRHMIGVCILVYASQRDPGSLGVMLYLFCHLLKLIAM